MANESKIDGIKEYCKMSDELERYTLSYMERISDREKEVENKG